MSGIVSEDTAQVLAEYFKDRWPLLLFVAIVVFVVVAFITLLWWQSVQATRRQSLLDEKTRRKL